ncbi:hypothetical protein [Lawsonibacter faecis]|uniref:Uncharacterized protein n=1 Tax=Lawsonibacter faecis TaxID=2763052 RepID=A0A8J6MDU7_9FIRM|nr:hypothetical protein [Lawsonibacter faecis]MBC5738800.1 hypothetical protein [Lawsonibacter faecis]
MAEGITVLFGQFLRVIEALLLAVVFCYPAVQLLPPRLCPVGTAWSRVRVGRPFSERKTLTQKLE